MFSWLGFESTFKAVYVHRDTTLLEESGSLSPQPHEVLRRKLVKPSISTPLFGKSLILNGCQRKQGRK